jgi:RNA polymerase sigma factor (TIGR02999 family)
VNEAFARLLAGRPVEVEDRAHFFALAASAMRHVLVDHAREHAAQKRGEGVTAITLDDALPGASASGPAAEDVLAVHEALEKLAELAPRQARVVELRYFGGLTLPEIAAHLSVSTVTIDGDWAAARAWLHRRLRSR